MDIPTNGLVRLSQIIGNPKANPPIPAIIPISRTAWLDGVKAGVLPQPIKLTSKTVAWKGAEIQALVDGEWPPAAAANEG